MPSLTRILPALFALVLLNAVIAGCAQKKKEAQPEAVSPKIDQPVAAPSEPVRLKKAQSEGCRTCHGPNAAAGDFSSIYNNPKSHHPVGVKYPDVPGFARLNGRNADIAFFDRNGNGQPDSDEVALFGTGGEVTVECASCHREHGERPVSAKDPGRLYLRVENTGSALCVTCHQR